ncbi:MAG: hypothetical protein GQ531_00870 [Sulfurovum sp.]|nr:hypothetical protein [Sulfurovum sp.]
MRRISFTVAIMSLFCSFSYGEVDLDSRLWKLAETDKLCRAVNFKDVNVNIFNEEGQTPLMIAAQHNNSRFIDCMIKAKADVLLEDYDERTAFDYLKKPQSKNEEIFTIRTYNALRRLEIYQIIGKKARIVQEDINLKKHIYKLYIEGAKCEEFPLPKDIECIFVEEKKRDGSAYAIYEHDIQRGVPAIFAAIQNRLYDKLYELLDEGDDIEMKNKFGDTPLTFAIKQNDDRLAKILLEYGSNPNVMSKNGFYTALSDVVVTNRILTAKLLLEHGSNVNYQYKKSETALTVAAKGCRNFDMVQLLLENGADPTLIDMFGMNTLTGLKRYCRDSTAYRKMKNFIERNSL